MAMAAMAPATVVRPGRVVPVVARRQAGLRTVPVAPAPAVVERARRVPRPQQRTVARPRPEMAAKPLHRLAPVEQARPAAKARAVTARVLPAVPAATVARTASPRVRSTCRTP